MEVVHSLHLLASFFTFFIFYSRCELTFFVFSFNVNINIYLSFTFLCIVSSCLCVVKAFSSKWKLPVLIFQTCNNYAGYVCIQLIDEANSASHSKSSEDSTPTTRRIIPLHIRGECYNYLDPSDVMIDHQNNSFHSKLQNIFEEMSLFLDNTESQIADQIVELASSSLTGETSNISSIIERIHITDNDIKKNKKEEGNYEDGEGDDDDEEGKSDDDQESNDDEEESDEVEDKEEEDDDEVGVEKQGGSSISSNSSLSTNRTTTSMNHDLCYFNEVMFPGITRREHTVGESENYKKYYFNVLR